MRPAREEVKTSLQAIGENNLVVLVLWHIVIRHELKRVLKYTPG